MALVVTHNSTADGDPLIDGDDWNANHTLTGGGTFRIPQLIETKTLAAGSTTTTFSSLDGNTDLEWLIVYDLIFIPGGTSKSIYINPNNDTGGNYDNSMFYLDRTGSGMVTNWPTQLFVLCAAGTNATTYSRGHGLFYPKSGLVRNMLNHTSEMVDNSTNSYRVWKDYWTNTADNITSLVIKTNGTSFSGTIKLYKMVDLTI